MKFVPIFDLSETFKNLKRPHHVHSASVHIIQQLIFTWAISLSINLQTLGTETNVYLTNTSCVCSSEARGVKTLSDYCQREYEMQNKMKSNRVKLINNAEGSQWQMYTSRTTYKLLPVQHLRIVEMKAKQQYYCETFVKMPLENSSSCRAPVLQFVQADKTIT